MDDGFSNAASLQATGWGRVVFRGPVHREAYPEDPLAATNGTTQGDVEMGLLAGDGLGSQPDSPGGTQPGVAENSTAVLTARAPKPREFPVSAQQGGDSLLRAVGAVRQEGTYSRSLCNATPVYCDVLRKDSLGNEDPAWCASNRPGVPVTTDAQGRRLGKEQVTQRTEHGVKAIVHVIGHVDFNRMKFRDEGAKKKGALTEVDDCHLVRFLKRRKEKEKEEKEKRQEEDKDDDEDDSSEEEEVKAQKKPPRGQTDFIGDTDVYDDKRKRIVDKQKHHLGMDLTGEDECDELHNIINTGHEDGALLTSGEVAKVIRQYLTRSVVAAARNKHCCILTTDTADIKGALSRGVQAAGVLKHGEYQDGLTIGGRVPVFDVQPMQVPKEFLSRWCSHHILVSPGNTKAPAVDFSPDEGGALLESDVGTLEQPPAEASARDVTDTVVKLLEAASKGSHGLVERPPARVVGVLVGGHVKSTRFDMLPYVRNRWPFLIIEGSGGYADMLASIITKIESRAGGVASKDDYQALLSNYDSSTAQVLYEGNWVLIRKGTVPEVVTRMLSQAISGDEILTRAWESYAAWNQLARNNELLYRNLMLCILVCGMLATAISIFQTFLQLTFQNETDGEDESGQRKWAGGHNTIFAHLHSSLSIVVVVLPITISLLQSITNRINAGAKWVSLKSCAEGLLSEIYMYRTRSGAYSEHEIKKAYEKRMKLKRSKEREQSNGTASVVGDEEGEGDDADGLAENAPVYATRSELLHVKLNQYTQELVTSEMSENNIPKYSGCIPPKEVTQYGDDGYSDLTIQAYADLRLTPKINAYNEDAAFYDRSKSRITLTIYGFGALGTALAALATFEALRPYNIGAWVALTTAVGSALTRYLDYTKSEWLHNKYTTVMHELESVESWWSSRGSDGAKSATMDQMVTACEDKITEEISEFKQQLKIAVAEAAKEAEKQAEERAQIQEKLRKGEQPDLVKKMDSLGLSRINSDAILGALKDPTSSDARKLIKTLQRIDDEFGGVIDEVKAAAEDSALGKIISTHIQDIAEYKKYMDAAGNIIENVKGAVEGGIHLNPLNLEKLIPHDLMETIKDTTKRKGFLSHIDTISRVCDPWQMSYGDILITAKKCGRHFHKQIGALPYRVAMEGVAKLCFQEVFTEFEEALDKLGLSALDFVESREQLDIFISEIRKLSGLPANINLKAIMTACSIPTIKTAFQGLSEAKVRSILKRGSKYFIESSPALELHKSISETTADMDLDVAFADNHEELIQTLCRAFELTSDLPAHFLEKEEIVSVFPDRVREQFAEKSFISLIAVLSRLQKGTIGKKFMDAWIRAPIDPSVAMAHTGGLDIEEPREQQSFRRGSTGTCNTFATSKSAAGKTMRGLGGKVTRLSRFSQLEVMLHSFQNRLKLSLAAERLSQIEINSLSKSSLLKKIRNIIGADPALNEELQVCNDAGIRLVLSGVRSAVSNSYPGRIFDMLTDELVSFDAGMMFTWDDREKLINRMKDFKGINVNKKPDEWLRSMLGYKSLIDRCRCLDTQQLKELIMRLQSLMGSTFGRRVFDKSLEHLNALDQDSYKEAGFMSWRDQMVDRFVSTCMNTDEEMVEKPCDDADVFRESMNMDEQIIRLTANLSVRELRTVILQIKELAGERVVANIFEAASKEINSEEVFHIFDSAFMLPPIRQRLIMCMTNLLINPLTQRTLHLADIAAALPDKTLKRLQQNVVLPEKHLVSDTILLDPGVVTSEGLRFDILDSCSDNLNRALVESLVKVFKGKARLAEVVEFLLAEMKLTAGYRLFLRLCSEVTSFCLREIVKSPRARQGLFPVFLKMVWYNRFGFKPRVLSRNSTEYTLVQVMIPGPVGEDGTFKLIEAKPTKEVIMVLLEEFCEDSHEEVEECLMHCTAAQLKDVIGSFYKILTSTHVGVFFQFLERSVILGSTRKLKGLHNADPELKRRRILEDEREKRLRNEGIVYVKHSLRLSSTRVFDSFDGFDVRLFTSRGEKEKRTILSRFIQSDDVISIIAAYNEVQMKSLFSYIKSNPAFRKFSDPEESDHDSDGVCNRCIGANKLSQKS